MNIFKKGLPVGRQGFTLIELLVVVGILAVLAIAALIAINPLEAQRRSRDSARLQDMARLSSVIEAYMNDEGSSGIASSTTIGAGQERSQDCATNWLNLDLCDYIKQVPMDPQNDREINVVLDTSATRSTVDPVAGYGFSYTAGDYTFCTYLEANKNAELLNDGQPDSQFDTGTDISIACAP